MDTEKRVRKEPAIGTDLSSLSTSTLFDEQKGNRLFGSLHGEACSLEDFISLPSTYGDYELAGGKLVYKPMTMKNHDRRRRLMQYFAEKVIAAMRLCLLQSTEESYIRVGNSVRRPDVSVGRCTSNTSTEYEYDGSVPNAVCEVTSSSNWARDFEKIKDYAEWNIEEYVIVHVHSSMNEPNGYEFGLYRFTEPDVTNKRYLCKEFKTGESLLNTSYFGSLNPNDFVYPVNVATYRYKDNVALQ